MRVYPFLLIVPFLSLGCATVSQPKPGKITLEEALKSVGTGLALMKKAELEANDNKEFMTGLMPSEAEVVFNISASNSTDGKIYVELTPVSSSPVQGKAGGSIGTSETLTRGNQITIKFRNIAFGKTTTTTSKDGQTVIVEGITDPAKLTEFINAAKSGGVTVMDQNNGGGQGGPGGLMILHTPLPDLDKLNEKKR